MAEIKQSKENWKLLGTYFLHMHTCELGYTQVCHQKILLVTAHNHSYLTHKLLSPPKSGNQNNSSKPTTSARSKTWLPGTCSPRHDTCVNQAKAKLINKKGTKR